MTTKQLTILEKQVSPVVVEAQQLNISSNEELTSASTLRENIKRVQKEIESDKEELYRPIKIALNEVNARYLPYEKPLKEALKIVNDKMSFFQTEQIKKAKEEADKIASRVAPGRGNLTPEKAMEKIANIEIPPTLDLTKFTKKQELLIEDISLIAREYLIPNEKMIFEALKEGKVINGAKLVDNYIPRSSQN